MNFLDYISNLKQKSVIPKVHYGTLVYKNTQMIFCIASYDLQEALVEAKSRFFGEIKEGIVTGIKAAPMPGSIKLNSHETIEIGTLFDKFINNSVTIPKDFPIIQSSPKKTRNDFLKSLIEN